MTLGQTHHMGEMRLPRVPTHLTQRVPPPGVVLRPGEQPLELRDGTLGAHTGGVACGEQHFTRAPPRGLSRKMRGKLIHGGFCEFRTLRRTGDYVLLIHGGIGFAEILLGFRDRFGTLFGSFFLFFFASGQATGALGLGLGPTQAVVGLGAGDAVTLGA